MSADSWYKVCLPGFPAAFTVFGVWLYWGENPLPLLAPAVAFWGVVILYYLFTHLYIPNRRHPLVLTILLTGLWLVAAITAHNLGRCLTSGACPTFLSIMG